MANSLFYMRHIIPKEITEMLDKQAPYLHYVEGIGMVLREDAPPEIVEIREKTLEWFREHNIK